MKLFRSVEIQPRKFEDFVRMGDKKGAVDYLRTLSQVCFFEEVVRAGFSIIGFHHGKPKVIEHVINQF